MSELSWAFERAKAEGRTALIPYLMAGFPEPGAEVELAVALERAGADVLEIGMPFSDPLADGPTVQNAGTRSLAAGTTMSDCIAVAASVRRRTSLPLVLMGYYNPLLAYGLERFCADAAAAGVCGLILPDLPPEEAGEMQAAARSCGLDIVYLVSPTSPEERIREVASVASGFIYCVSLTGVTGARESVAVGLEEYLSRVRAHTDLPLAVGFGISRPEHVRQVGAVADGVVVASALLDVIDAAAPEERTAAVEEYIGSLRTAAEREVQKV